MEKIAFYEELEKQTNEIYESTEYQDIVPQLLSIAKAEITILKRCYRDLQIGRSIYESMYIQ